MALGKKPFEWPQGNPRNEDDFTRLMWAIDKHLASEGRQLLYRVCEFNIERLLEEGVGWTGSYELQSGLADVPDYTGAPLLAKAYRWYKQVYGERACGRGAVADAWSVGFIAVELGNGAVWKVRIPIVWGVPRFLYDRKDCWCDGGWSSRCSSSLAFCWFGAATTSRSRDIQREC